MSGCGARTAVSRTDQKPRAATLCKYSRARVRALRDDCLTIFQRAVTPFLPALDGAARRWLTRSCSPYVPEIAQIAAALGFPGVLAA